MSADNWAVCPRCRLKAGEERQAYDEKLAKAYGSVSPDEYLNLVSQGKNIPTVESFNRRMLREDYDLGIRGNEFYVSYYGACQDCDFEYGYERRIRNITSEVKE